MNNSKKIILLILDGWGLAPKSEGNAIELANKPNFDALWKNFPHCQLKAHGKNVGLPDNQVGNSEAGHLNIGAGRVAEQDATAISNSIRDGKFRKNSAFKAIFNHVKIFNSRLHLMGNVSDENSPHCSLDHLRALMDLAVENHIETIHLHLFTDGRDTLQHSATKIIDRISSKEKAAIVSIIGRFYAMDRAKNWERTRKAYDCLTKAEGEHFRTYQDAILQSYNSGLTDEYVLPSIIADCRRDTKKTRIRDNDGIIFFNLRSDRARQITKCFVQSDFNKKNPGAFKRGKILKNLKFCALTDFGPDLDDIQTAFPGAAYQNTLPLMLQRMPQLYIAESEKYAHMTYFINGGYADPINGEHRLKINSPKTENYADTPEMSAYEITDQIIENLPHYDFIAANLANPDMVGHTGNLDATIKAIEHCDICLGKIANAARQKNTTLVITSDHGNAEKMIDTETGEIYPLHTTNPVPFIIVDEKLKNIKSKDGTLANIAPTIYKIFGIEHPKKSGLAKPLF